jgi:hypothetical protein
MTPPRLSRRSWFVLAGSGTALAALTALWRRRDAAAEAAVAADPIDSLVDHDGWIVTLEERQALVRRKPR